MNNIIESYSKIKQIQDSINNMLIDFISKSSQLIDLSEDDYQIEKSLKLNKISLKGFLLDSPCCTILKEKEINDYTINDLKNYLVQYENSTNEDCSKYYLSVSLYELIDNIEKTVDSKIDLEVKELSKIIPSINNINNSNKNEYEALYLNIKKELDYKELDEQSHNIAMIILNDIFNFYISGYPTIPEEYLYKPANNSSI